mgnify:CR=1 FL=1
MPGWKRASTDEPSGMLDPTPAEGRPGIVTVSLWRRIGEIGNEIEYFYDRNILGFSTLEQVLLVERARDLLARVDRLGERHEGSTRGGPRRRGCRGRSEGIAVALAIALRQRRRLSPATRAYLDLSRLHARRIGELPESAPSGAVIRGFAREPGVRREPSPAGSSRDLPGQKPSAGWRRLRGARASCAALSASFRESPRRFRS